jgi:hypothetical protein
MGLSLNLGSLVKNDYLETKAGETAEFTILFWNAGGSSFNLLLREKITPEKWSVIFKPNNFILEPSKLERNLSNEYEYINLPGTGDVIRMVPVKVFVRVPKEIKSGQYEVIVSGITSYPNEDISVTQEREFILRLKVIGNHKPSEEMEGNLIGENSSSVNETQKKEISGMVSVPSENSRLIFFVIMILIILCISLVIYRHV